MAHKQLIILNNLWPPGYLPVISMVDQLPPVEKPCARGCKHNMDTLVAKLGVRTKLTKF